MNSTRPALSAGLLFPKRFRENTQTFAALFSFDPKSCILRGRKGGDTMEDILIIGIAGGSGSGKTTLVKGLQAQFGDALTVLSHDNYYKAHDDLTYEERTTLNYDHPDAFDTDLMIEHLKLLKKGRPIHCPVYDYTVHNRSREVLLVEPTRVIVVEGILIFENKALCEQMDIRIFVDADADVRLCRRIKRDVEKRGRTIESVISQYLATVKPMHEQFVEPSKKNANLVVPEGGKNLVAQELIMERIRKHIQAQAPVSP